MQSVIFTSVIQQTKYHRARWLADQAHMKHIIELI